jgi:hypothetical protein
VSSNTIVSDAPNCVITRDDSKGIIYDRNIFIIQATIGTSCHYLKNLLFHHRIDCLGVMDMGKRDFRNRNIQKFAKRFPALLCVEHLLKIRRHDTQQKDTQHNVILHSETWHKGLICDIQHK